MTGELKSEFRTPDEAERAAQELRLAGFGADQIEVHESEGGMLDALVPATERERPATLAVQADGRALEAAAILYRHGGRDLEPAPTVEHRSGAPQGERLELVEEQLVPRVQAVPVGEVVVRKKVVREKRTIEVEVLREEIVVERAPAAAAEPVGEAEAGHHVLGADEEITRVALYEERLVVEKRPVLREHVVIRKRRVPHVEQVADTVRREVPVVKTAGQVTVDDRTSPGVRARA